MRLPFAIILAMFMLLTNASLKSSLSSSDEDQDELSRDGKSGILLRSPRSSGIIGFCQMLLFFIVGMLMYCGAFIQYLLKSKK
jgi:hypothetical protein